MLAQQIQWKRGDTWAPLCQYQSPPGTPADISGFLIYSMVRNRQNNAIVATLTAVPGVGEGNFTFEPTDTSAWPLGTLVWDIEYYQEGSRMYTETVELVVVDYVTTPYTPPP